MKIIIVILVAAAIAFFLLRRKSNTGKLKTGETPKKLNPYRAVSINAADGGCAAVQEIAGERFLSGETPQLPLPGCRSSNCQCTFIHHTDRRETTDDRRAAYSVKTDVYSTAGDGERREKRGRRKTD